MARQKTSVYEDFITLASKLPWWLDILLAIVSYFVLHGIASRPAPVVTAPGQMGAAATHGMLTMFATFGQFLIPLAFGVAALISAIDTVRQKKVYERIESRRDVAAIEEIGWEDFERLIGEYYRRKGFAVNRGGGDGPDGGVDLVLRKGKERYLVQCKHWKAYKIPVQLVREFYGVMASQGADGGYFVTSGVYTKEASAFAKGLNLELVDGHKLRLMINATRKRAVVTDIQLNMELTQIPPTCPVCGGNMKKRIARRGKHTGEPFWGCTNYPKCRAISAIPSIDTGRREISSLSPP
ncbi:MAG TPA: restriction endonuclease [Deltaproteobacteria bacterium]|nr:restriction endonuclease [Deltaproteobacteria bacterium]